MICLRIKGNESATIHRLVCIFAFKVVASMVIDLCQFTLRLVVLNNELDVHEVIGIVAMLQCSGRCYVPPCFISREKVTFLGLIDGNFNVAGECSALFSIK